MYARARVRMRVRMCVRGGVNEQRQKIGAKKFSQKSCKNICRVKINAYLCSI